MRMMSEQLLVEETMDRTRAQIAAMLGLMRQAFADSRERARALSLEFDHIVDPEAASLLDEAEALLISAKPRVESAIIALLLAALREPRAYGQLLGGVLGLLEGSLDEVTAAELAAAMSTLRAAGVQSTGGQP